MDDVYICLGMHPHSLSPMKECKREASVPSSWHSMQYQPKLMNCCSKEAEGLQWDVLWCPAACYDLSVATRLLPLLSQPHGLSPQENVIKECEEEASIPRELAQLAVPAGAVSYCSEQTEGLKRDVLFCYDLELPQDFVPEPQVLRRLHL